MTITVAGEKKEYKDGLTLPELIELENVHDDGIVFEPIHRVLFNLDTDKAIAYLMDKLAHDNGSCEMKQFKSKAERDDAMADDAEQGAHMLPFCLKGSYGYFKVKKPSAQLEVGTLQNALDAMLKEFKGAVIDYIHGEDVVYDLGTQDGNMGFLLPPMDKGAFFRTVIFDGALPRKTFSMGEANEKRYYLECKSIKK